MFVKPAPGTSVPDVELGGILPPEGREVPANQYWLRRVADGDVTNSDEPAAVETKGNKK